MALNFRLNEVVELDKNQLLLLLVIFALPHLISVVRKQFKHKLEVLLHLHLLVLLSGYLSIQTWLRRQTGLDHGRLRYDLRLRIARGLMLQRDLRGPYLLVRMRCEHIFGTVNPSNVRFVQTL